MVNGKFLVEYNLPFTCEGFVNQVEKLPDYSYIRKVDDLVEKDCTYFPSFVNFFYKTTVLQNKLLSHFEYAQVYIDKFFEIKNENELIYKNKVYSRDGLLWHIYRTYPSLIRDFHFYLFLNTDSFFEFVKYTTEDDLRKKIDITVSVNSVEYYLRLFVNTKKSNEYYKNKNSKVDNANVIDVGLDLNDAYKTKNNYVLYSRKYINRIKEEITKNK
jgi:hypothetical protein